MEAQQRHHAYPHGDHIGAQADIGPDYYHPGFNIFQWIAIFLVPGGLSRQGFGGVDGIDRSLLRQLGDILLTTQQNTVGSLFNRLDFFIEH
ncbi:hypothetical protein EIO60_00962|nr:hypothetical protein [Candidatus Pantoea persica]